MTGPGCDSDPWGAFVPGPRARAAPLAGGPLDGTRFAVKDLIDVSGVVTTGGNPDWAASHGPAAGHAPAVDRLLRSGARLVGKTVTDELAFSLEGENVHHGTPRNPAAAGCLPGGSSSGSAVAVAAGQAEFALGTDTGGSVRVPAAFCGVFGFRPTHGSVSLDGVLPFAPSFDTLGWIAADGGLLERVGKVLLRGVQAGPALRLRWAADVASLADDAAREAVLERAATLPLLEPSNAFAEGAPSYLQAYQVLQGDEIRRSLGPWIDSRRPRFGAAIAERFAGIRDILPEQVARWHRWREIERLRVVRALGGDGAWVFPTTPCPPLPVSAAPGARARFYQRALAINAVAGLAGLPQVTLPAGALAAGPVALSVVGPPGSDLRLLALAAAWRVDGGPRS